MGQKQLKNIHLIKRITSIGILLGLLLFVSSFLVGPMLVEELYHAHLLFIGMSIMVSSMITFGFSLFIHVMEQVASPEANQPKKQASSLHTFYSK